jgi:hypothetical protein
MFRLARGDSTIGRYYKSEREAKDGLEFYIKDHRKHFAGLVERDYYAYDRKVLFSECERIAEAMLRSEIQIKAVK